MAARNQSYKLVDNHRELRSSIRQLNHLEPGSLVAVDCEGVSLSREGELTIVTVATEAEEVYIFDVAVLDDDVFDKGLRDILEDSTREKLMFDCRGDSDSLWHQYGVRLSGVLDVQLLEVMYRRRHQSSEAHNPGYVDYVRGFGQCLEVYVKNKQAIKTKDFGKNLMRKDYKVWKRRPLPETLIHYCVVDTLQIFDLFYNLMQGWKRSSENIPGLKTASERYADLHRGKPVRYFDEYESNAFLPAEIISYKAYQGAIYLTCQGCQRSLPKPEFPGDTKKCSVCRRIDQKKRKNHRKYEKHDDYYDSDEDRYDDYDDGCYGEDYDDYGDW